MDQSSIPLQKLGIPPEFARFVDPNGPKEFKVLAAKGMMPAPPRVLLALQYCLIADPDAVVSATARDALLAHPAKFLEANLDDRTHPKLLEFFAFERAQDEALMELILLKRQLNDRAFCHLAEVVGPKLVEIVAGNQERLLTAPATFGHLKKNPAATKAILDRVESFLRMNGALEEPEHAVVEDPKVSQVILALTSATPDELSGDLSFKHGFEEEGEGLPTDLTLDKEGRGLEENEDEKKGDLWSTVSKLPVGKKIKLAYFGNAMVRSILVRDTNKVVATSVIKSPRMTENEVVGIARNRNVCQDVLREIARNKEMFKLYAVKLALVNNPKCPTTVSMAIVNQLMAHDLKSLASNRNVPSVIATTAKQAINKKGPR